MLKDSLIKEHVVPKVGDHSVLLFAGAKIFVKKTGTNGVIKGYWS